MTEDSVQRLAVAYQSLRQHQLGAAHTMLARYTDELGVLQDEYDRTPGPPPKPITVPAIFGREYNENFISDYLAYAIDPARNGIGEAPLAELLMACGVDADDLALGDVAVRREYWLGDGRIDLLLEWEDTLVVGIENKVLATENPGQTLYYAEWLPKVFDGVPYSLIFLTRQGDQAESPEFRSLSYPELVEAFRRVALPADASPRARVLWEDLLEHLEVYIIMSDPAGFEFSDKAKLYLRHRKLIRDLTTAYEEEWAKAIAYVERRLYARLVGGPWTTDFRAKTYWHLVHKPVWRSSLLSVYYQYLMSSGDLDRGRIRFMVQADAAGQQKRFLELFDERYPALEDRYQELGIIYRPPFRRRAIAYKEYAIEFDIEKIAQVYIDAWNEFQFLTPEVDRVLAELQSEGDASV